MVTKEVIDWFDKHDIDYDWKDEDIDIVKEGLRKIQEKHGSKEREKQIEGFISGKGTKKFIDKSTKLDDWIDTSNARYKRKIVSQIETAQTFSELDEVTIDKEWRDAEDIEEAVNDKKVEIAERIEEERAAAEEERRKRETERQQRIEAKNYQDRIESMFNRAETIEEVEAAEREMDDKYRITRTLRRYAEARKNQIEMEIEEKERAAEKKRLDEEKFQELLRRIDEERR